jgi:hypothetical protein
MLFNASESELTVACSTIVTAGYDEHAPLGRAAVPDS